MKILTLVFALCATQAASQSFEEIFATAQQQAGEMSQYQQALQNPDQRVQYSLVQQMLKHPDPGIQRIAKEHALFSTNPLMREAGIKAIFDSGARLRMQVAVTSETSGGIASWLTKEGGVFAEGRGEVLLSSGEAIAEDCWGTKSTRPKCTFRQVGNSVQYNEYATNIVMNLGNDGVLRGTLTYSLNSTKESGQVQIDLKE